MTLAKIEDFYPNYRDELFDGEDFKGIDVYADGSEDKIGTVKDILVDEQSGSVRYFVIDTGFWIFGKKVLLPVGRSRIDANQKRIYTLGLTKEQVENLPEFNDLERIDGDYEEQVRGIYRPQTSVQTDSPIYDRDSYNYEQEPSLYGINDRDHATLKLYQERLVTNKERHKVGEVAIGKHIETETTRVTVPLEKERIEIERTTPENAGRTIASGDVNFQDGEMVRMDIYEETPDIHKEAFVREEVKVRKEVFTEAKNVEAQIRREELNVDEA